MFWPTLQNRLLDRAARTGLSCELDESGAYAVMLDGIDIVGLNVASHYRKMALRKSGQLAWLDDGAASMEMAMEMLRLSAQQGIAGVFATPHSSAFDLWGDEAGERFLRLKARAGQLFPEMALFLGCEVYCEARRMDAVLAALKAGKYPSMNGTKYVLMEFSPQVKLEEAKSCVQTLLGNGWRPVMAHVERYQYFQGLPELAARFREMGCFIQINAYSVAEEKDPAIRQRARRLLEQKLVDFLGTDAHCTGHRPPSAEMGLRWINENCEKDCAYAVIRSSAERLLMN